MSNLSSTLSEAVSKLGRSFFIAGFVPATLYVVAHQFFLFPRWLGKSPVLFQTSAPGEGAPVSWQWVYLLDQIVTLVLLPLVLGVILFGLNTFLIRLYEGAFAWQRRGLLRFWQHRNERKSRELYGELMKLKSAYQRALMEMAQPSADEDEALLKQQHDSLVQQIQELHTEIEREEPAPTVPRRPQLVRPTALGNVFALAEEYSYERYGMDSVLFWPRLRPLVSEAYADMLADNKMVLDLLLHLSFLSYLFAMEGVVFGTVTVPPDWYLVATGVGAGILGFLFYRGATDAARNLGQVIRICFDYFRGILMEQFGLERPSDLLAEQVMWLRIGRFLHRGEGFYYPAVGDDAELEGTKQMAE